MRGWNPVVEENSNILGGDIGSELDVLRRNTENERFQSASGIREGYENRLNLAMIMTKFQRLFDSENEKRGGESVGGCGVGRYGRYREHPFSRPTRARIDDVAVAGSGESEEFGS